jgi:Uma2 family endonuclease
VAAQLQIYLTVEEYLAGERSSTCKHEYYAGEVFAMAGGTEQHNLIGGNIFASLHQQLRKRSCNTYSSDMRVTIPSTDLYTYPDVTVVCGKAQFEDDHHDTLLNPTVIVEVLSSSTEMYDRGKKFQNYRTLASLQEYLLVAQDEYRIEHFIRQPDGQWLLSEAKELEAIVILPSIACQLALVDVYEKVEF